VLTFEELTRLFEVKKITLEQSKDETEASRARFFPTTGGILKTMLCNNDNYTYVAIDGVENCISALKDIENGNLNGCFIEMSTCVGSCIGGPVMEKYHRSPIRDYKEISIYSGKKDFNVDSLAADILHKNYPYININKDMPDENEIRTVLLQMGKTKPEHCMRRMPGGWL